ncbi:hypothetical protein SAMN02910317_01196 [Ruminococcaceae bacterium FB2012]|nr:hypothetical protein SAMN02910317_01196 [Ruminococcaceae bacterium FB2012]
MTRDQAKALIKQEEPYFLDTAPKRINRHDTYVCPECGNGSGRHGTGIVLIPGSEHGKRWKCFVCGLCEDIIGLYMTYYGVGYREAFDDLYEHFDLDV